MIWEGKFLGKRKIKVFLGGFRGDLALMTKGQIIVEIKKLQVRPSPPN